MSASYITTVLCVFLKGHYVTDVYDINSDQWYTCDDSHISFTSEETVLTTRKKTGYILFYLSK